MGNRASIRKAELYASDLPWNVYQAEDLGPSIMGFCREHEPYFRRWARTWFENFMFIYGNQHIRWSKRYGFAVDYDHLAKQSTNFALYVYTNVVRTITESLASAIYSNLPTWETQAMDESGLKGKRFEKIVQKFLDCYMQRLMMDKEFTAAALIYVTFGQFAADVNWRYNLGRLTEIPRLQRVQRPVYSDYMAPNQFTGGLLEVPTSVADQYGNPVTENIWEPKTDASGRQIIDKIFSGDAGVDMLTPFEYRREMGTNGFHKTRWAERFRLLDYDQFMDEYHRLPGKTDFYDQVRPVFHDETVFNFAVRHYMRMQFVTSPTLSDNDGAPFFFSSKMFRYKVFVVEHYDRPHPIKWPLGRRVIVANGFCTHITTPSYSTSKLDGWHPYVEAQWMAVPPSSISSGPVNDAVRKNRELNVLDSLRATAVRRNMGSQLLFKTGSGLNPQMFSGEPGIAHECNDPYAVRWLHDDMPIPPVMARFREMDKEDIYESSAAIEAVRGAPSTGASSGYQEKQREEREEKRIAPARKAYEYAVAGIGEKLFACVRANARDKLDPEVMGFLKRSAAGEYSTQDVIALLTTPVDYGVDIKIVKSSMALKSKATMQATLQELAGGALGQRLASDAKVLDQYLKFFDADQFRDSSAPQRDRAQRENEAFLDLLRLGPNTEGIKLPIVVFEDSDEIHEAEHDEFIVKNFDELRNHQWLMMVIMSHKEQHRIQRMEKQGTIAPGASQQIGGMMAQASAVSKPNLTTIQFMTEQQRALGPPPVPGQPQGQEPQASGGAAPAPAPGQAGGGQPPPTGGQSQRPAAPSSQTPAGKRQSVATRGGMQ